MNKCYGWQKNYKLVLYLPHTTTKKYPQTNKNKTKQMPGLWRNIKVL